ncbi:poly(u)-specific endoribonuclease-like [Plakobranchus ocellatus]|uniref:Uridylate-specific endoribonuclease n=1 Tax=Plakobranchus ocellatus TaxID=259542 RepID=A0AAV3ZZH0_9GAST|nr:poly(u)-specific endoribonuclease-like [Plakobranchus ocellatus]
MTGNVATTNNGFFPDDSCQGRCDSPLDKSKTCQCNSACVNYNDCCWDYSTLCLKGSSPQTCQDFDDVTSQLWSTDADRLPTDAVRVNYQADMGYTTFADKASQKLFSYVDQTRLTSQMYSTYMALLNNYDPDKYDLETVTSHEKQEEEAFLDAILSTRPLAILYEFLLCKNKVQDKSDMRTLLRRLWFEVYSRGSGSSVHDTSGFEHVMVGEYKSFDTVSGLHYWLAFYEKELRGQINYYGRTCRTQTNTACVAFEWDNRTKKTSSFFLRSSPAFDIAIYTLCFIMYPDADCPVVIDGSNLKLQTYSKDGHVATVYIK